MFLEMISCDSFILDHLSKVSKGAKIRNRYNQVPHLTQDTDGKVTNSQLDTTNESQEVSPVPAGDHKAHINRLAQRHSKHKTEKNIKDPQKKYRLETSPNEMYSRTLPPTSPNSFTIQDAGEPLCLDALFGHFKQSSNKPSPRCQSRRYIAPPKFNY